MVQFNLNNLFMVVETKASIISNLKYLRQFLPHFYLHDNLPVAENCCACLAELFDAEKPVAACVTEIEQNFNVWTDNPFSIKARENVFSFLFTIHTLDFTICEQAGECYLQDQTKNFANNSSRFFFKKRGVVDKSSIFGLKTIMTPCTNCTPCVRYTSLHTAALLGIFNRGSSSQIGQYSKKTQQSLININVVDYCPVAVFHNNDTGKKVAIDNFQFRKVQRVINFFVLACITFVVTSIVVILFYRYVLHEEYLFFDMGEFIKGAMNTCNTAWSTLDPKEYPQADKSIITRESNTIHPGWNKAIEDAFSEWKAFYRPAIVPCWVNDFLCDQIKLSYEKNWIACIAKDLSVAQGLVINSPIPLPDGKGFILPPITIYKWNQTPHFVIVITPLIFLIFSLIISFLLSPGILFFRNLKKDFFFFFEKENLWKTLFVLLLLNLVVQWFWSEIYYMTADMFIKVVNDLTYKPINAFYRGVGQRWNTLYDIYKETCWTIHRWVWR